MGDLTFAPGKPADQLLVEFAVTGRQEPFEEIVRRYAPMVFGTCMRVLKNKHDAEDAVQAVFLSLAVQAKANREIRYLGPWLQQVAHRVSLDIRRGKKRRKAREEKHNEIRTANLTTPATPGDVEEMKRIISEELGQLPAKYRVPLVLFYFGGMSRDQIAAELKCNPSTLGVRMHRAREMLGNRLAGRGVALTPVVLAYLLGEAVKSAVGDSLIHSTSAAAARIVQVKVGAAVASAAVQDVVSSNVLRLAHGAARSVAVARLKATLAVGLIAATVLGAGAGAVTKAVGPVMGGEGPRVAPQYDGNSWIGDIVRRAAEKLIPVRPAFGAAVGGGEGRGQRSEVRNAGKDSKAESTDFGGSGSGSSSRSEGGGRGAATGAVRVGVAVTNDPRWPEAAGGGATGTNAVRAGAGPVAAGAGPARRTWAGSGISSEWPTWSTGAVSAAAEEARRNSAGQGGGVAVVPGGTGSAGGGDSLLAMVVAPQLSTSPVNSSPAAPPSSPVGSMTGGTSSYDDLVVAPVLTGGTVAAAVPSSAVADGPATPVLGDGAVTPSPSSLTLEPSVSMAGPGGAVVMAGVMDAGETAAGGAVVTSSATYSVAVAPSMTLASAAGVGSVDPLGGEGGGGVWTLAVHPVLPAGGKVALVRPVSGGAAAPGVPEPTGGVVLVAVAGVLALRRRRRR